MPLFFMNLSQQKSPCLFLKLTSLAHPNPCVVLPCSWHFSALFKCWPSCPRVQVHSLENQEKKDVFCEERSQICFVGNSYKDT